MKANSSFADPNPRACPLAKCTTVQAGRRQIRIRLHTTQAASEKHAKYTKARDSPIWLRTASCASPAHGKPCERACSP
eukprot:10301689-Alexandrium_andersonii.AAC.1